jgi:4'-phosphopantetheinyl transferase
MDDAVQAWLAQPSPRLARDVLAHVTGTTPAAIRCDRTCRLCGDAMHGKPRLAGGPSFNLAHTAGLAVLAVGPVEVGVDVERDTGRDLLEGSGLALAQSERPLVVDAPAPTAAFLALWTRKEAYLKGTGHGLTEDPSAVTFRAADDGWETVLHAGRVTAWHVRPLPVPRPFVAAIAVVGRPRPVRLTEWRA